MNTHRHSPMQRRPLAQLPSACWLLVAVLLLTTTQVVPGHAQSPSAQPGQPELAPAAEMYDMRLETEMLEQQYDRVITQALDRYFDAASYLVRTSLTIEQQTVRMVEPAAPPEEPAEEVAPVRIPGVPYVPNFVERERSFAEEIAALIGQSYTRTTVTRVLVELRPDIGYSEQEIEFMQQIVRSAARLSDARGDRIEVSQTAFPGPETTRQALQAAQQALQAVEQELQEQQDQQSPALATSPLFGAESLGSMLSDADARRALVMQLLTHPTALLLFVIALIMLLATLVLAILLFRGIPVRTRGDQPALAADDGSAVARGGASVSTEPMARAASPAQPARSAGQRENITRPADTRPESVSGPLSGDGYSADRASMEVQPNDARYLSDLIYNHPADVARYFEKRMVTEGQSGLRQIAGVFSLVDRKMVRLLKPYMSSMTFTTLRKKIDTSVTETTDLSGKELKALIAFLKNSERPDSYLFKFQPLNDFEFVRHVSAALFGQLVATLKDPETALIAGHMPKGVVQQWLGSLTDERIQRIVQSLPQAEKIAYKEYSEIAERLFGLYEAYKTRDVYPKSMVDEMVELIENMPVRRQQRMIGVLQKDSNDYNRHILSRLVTFDDVLSLPENELARVLEVFDAETMAMACTSLAQDELEKVLQCRPDRERSVVSNLIRTKAADYGEEMVSEARLQIVREARPYIRLRQEQSQPAGQDAPIHPQPH